MANKPAPRNWSDIQLAIATGSMAFTLAFWNVFAGPDREAAIKRAQEQAALPPPQPTQAAPAVESQPVQQTAVSQGAVLPGSGPILLGGSAPQTEVIVQVGGSRGGGGGGGPATSTSSS